ncbi:MAG: 2-dehydropantoate 2-reductase [Proteobacteria bacterium SG_bin9]|nr:MAG: 2-dehydropantoate 2-reductase [Proteobacteria bacterium SG_bin9]
MRILVVGAGAVGGYFGARLAAAGKNVHFLVRPARAALLRDKGLTVVSPVGDVRLETPLTVTAAEISSPFDLIILTCKAFDLAQAIDDIQPAVGANSRIIPLLNGMSHLGTLERHFGSAKVLGGQCAVTATVTPEGTIRHLNAMHAISFGEREGGISETAGVIEQTLSGAGFDVRASDTILQDMWEKWYFLATMAAATCLMRGPLGAILAAPGGRTLIEELRSEVTAIASKAGHAPRPPYVARTDQMLFQQGSPVTASMLRDMLAGLPIEADQIIGDLIDRADLDELAVPALRTAYAHLRVYQAILAARAQPG